LRESSPAVPSETPRADDAALKTRRNIEREELMSDITVIIVCACLMAAAGSFRWHRRFAMTWGERTLFDIVIMAAIMGVAARLAKAMGQAWFAERFSPMDHAVMFAALAVSLILVVDSYRRRPLRQQPVLIMLWAKFYIVRNALYIGVAYLYLTKSAQMLVRSVGFDPASPILALKSGVLIALVGYAGVRLVEGVRGASQRRPLDARG
jgi:hypothetical protein